jgi:hypothetical protein
VATNVDPRSVTSAGTCCAGSPPSSGTSLKSWTVSALYVLVDWITEF